jgi:hypothetical protein
LKQAPPGQHISSPAAYLWDKRLRTRFGCERLACLKGGECIVPPAQGCDCALPLPFQQKKNIKPRYVAGWQKAAERFA